MSVQGNIAEELELQFPYLSTKFELEFTIIHKFGDFKESLQVAAPPALLLLAEMLALCSVALGHFQQGIAHEWAHSGRL